MTRQLLRRMCQALIGVVLLAQLTVSAYACPALAPAVAMSATAAQPMSACDDMASETMDPAFAALCAAHCHTGHQSDQAPSLVVVPVALPTALYSIAVAAETRVAPGPLAAASSALVAASPPHTVLHCCFRI